MHLSCPISQLGIKDRKEAHLYDTHIVFFPVMGIELLQLPVSNMGKGP